METIFSKLTDARAVRVTLQGNVKDYLPVIFDIILTVPDRPGIIAGFTTCLARGGINITDIEILRVREGEGGTIRVGFASEQDQESAIQVLRKRGYTVRKAF